MLTEAMRRKSEAEARRYTYRDLGNDSGVDWSFAAKLAKDQRHPSRPVVEALARALHPYLPLSEALMAAGYLPDEATPETLSRLLRGESEDGINFDDEEIPWIEDLPSVHLGAKGTLVDQIALWPVRLRRGGNRVPVRANSNCMSPTIADGDVVILDLDAAVESGNIVAIETEAGWTIRRYRVNGHGPSFTCDNPNADDGGLRPLPETPVYRVVELRKRL